MPIEKASSASRLEYSRNAMCVIVRSTPGTLEMWPGTRSAMASWVLARRKGRLVGLIYAADISGIILPPAVVTIVLLLRYLGLSGTAIGMICVYAGMYMSTVVFFVTGFVRTIPPELEEAARIDGASPVRVFVQVILPLLRPTLATATILICLYIWNDVFYALFVVGGRLDTLPLNLYQVASSGLYLQNWHLIFAYIILMSLPLLLTFVVLQRRIISGITSGAVTEVGAREADGRARWPHSDDGRRRPAGWGVGADGVTRALGNDPGES